MIRLTTIYDTPMRSEYVNVPLSGDVEKTANSVANLMLNGCSEQPDDIEEFLGFWYHQVLNLIMDINDAGHVLLKHIHEGECHVGTVLSDINHTDELILKLGWDDPDVGEVANKYWEAF